MSRSDCPASSFKALAPGFFAVMHWKGLRISSSDGNDSKRRSFVEPQSNFRYSEQLPRPSLSNTHLPPPRRSESAPRSPLQAEPEHTDRPQSNCGPHDGSENIITKTPSPGAGLSATDGSNVRRNRFSFFRLRHASDPQLSKSYAKAEEDIPPVPSLPPRWSTPLIPLVSLFCSPRDRWLICASV